MVAAYDQAYRAGPMIGRGSQRVPECGRHFRAILRRAVRSRDGPPSPVRDYYRVEDREGRRFWVFRVDGDDASPHPRWFLQGLFA